jgi:hypothetical protein
VGNTITNFIRKAIFTRENLWAVILAVMIVATLTCATIGVQPQFVYTGF